MLDRNWTPQLLDRRNALSERSLAARFLAVPGIAPRAAGHGDSENLLRTTPIALLRVFVTIHEMVISKPRLRRHLLRAAMAAPFFALAGITLRPLRAWAGAWPNDLFAATSIADLQARLGSATPERGDNIFLDVPEIIDDGMRVKIRVTTSIPLTDSISIAIDGAPRPLVAQFNLSRLVEADVTTFVKLPWTTKVHALVKANGKVYSVAKEIKLAEKHADAMPHQVKGPA